MKKAKLLIWLFFLPIFILNSSAQGTTQNNSSLGDTKFVVVGNAQADYVSSKDSNGFGNVAFKPIFLWSLSDKLFIESELEVSTDSGSVEVLLEYANMVYFVNNNLTFHFGRFLPKFGSYRGKYM